MRASSGRRPFALAIALSALFHLLVFLLLPLPDGGARAVVEPPLEVALLQPEPPKPPPAPATRQMVAPPDRINDRPPENPRFESDRDNTVDHETVALGVPNPGVEAPPAPKAPPQRAVQPQRPAPPAPKQMAQRPAPPPRPATPPEPKHAPAFDDLFASTEELVQAQRAAQPRQQQTEAAENGEAKRRLALAVPPLAPEWALSGPRGTFDNLPDIQRGAVTLLNTKANEFSPFVRRVGERVFQHLVIRQRRLELEQIMNARHPVQMRAILDRTGKLKSVQIDDQSGSATMDDTLSDALNTAAFDNNPPAAAANANGDFEFVFQAQLRAYQPGPGGSPGRIESRLSVALM